GNEPYVAFDSLHSALLGESAQVAREAGGVEMQGIGHLVEWRVRCMHRARKSPLDGRDGLNRIFLERRRFARQKHLQPVGLKRDVADPGSGGAERVEIKMARPGPVAESDAELVGGLHVT